MEEEEEPTCHSENGASSSLDCCYSCRPSTNLASYQATDTELLALQYRIRSVPEILINSTVQEQTMEHERAHSGFLDFHL